MTPTDRAREAERIVRSAGALALDYFRQQSTLKIDRKGHQDFVSQADRDVERAIREDLARTFPGDAIVGEEEATTEGTTGFTWVIDPIDGTANFINAIPAWTVVLAGVQDGRTQIGLIYDPCHDEMYFTLRGEGATLNGNPLRLERASLTEGTVSIGFSARVGTDWVSRMIPALVAKGGVYHRNASGALSLAYTAAGRFVGYAEDHMNAWDCLAGQLLVAEAGGRIEDQDADQMIARGGRVIAASPGVFDDLVSLSNAASDP